MMDALKKSFVNLRNKARESFEPVHDRDRKSN
jgi:hypothetical protein